MRIGVLVKQVPATENVKIDEKTGVMMRSGVESELNPLDMYAVEEAVRIKERLGGEVVVLSMGPPSAEYAVRDALSMGCDRGFLISDRLFAGSDTLATARILSAAILKLGGFDMIFAGERATDGETGQVGPGVAARLGVSLITYVRKISDVDNFRVVAERAVEEGTEIVEAALPALITVVKEINEPRVPDLAGKIGSMFAQIPVLSGKDISINKEKVGLKGSPTRVAKVFYPKLTRNGRIIDGRDPEKAVAELIRFLKEKSIL